MHAKNVLVKSTETVETLGSINAIASDKTGTLTQNRMTVRHAIFNSSQVKKLPQGRELTFHIPASKLDQETESVDRLDAVTRGINRELSLALAEDSAPPPAPSGHDEDIISTERRGSWSLGTHPINRVSNRVRSSNQELVDLIRCAGLCNHSTFEPGQETTPILLRKATSDPSEAALLKFAHSHSSVYTLRERNVEVGCIPFSSSTKWMLTIHKEKVGFRCIIKGAPERVLERCSHHGDHEPLTPDILSDIEEANAEVAENGERVLAFAERLLPDLPHDFEFVTDETDGINFPITGYRFVGMLSLEDPPREEVPAAVHSCHEAGIQVIMVTGDHPLTARSIAGQVNILQPNEQNELAPLYDTKRPIEQRCDPTRDCVVVTGSELDSFTDNDWDYVLTRRDIVFARTLPHQKQQIVAKLQAKDLVVAVTGDGVNDAPGALLSSSSSDTPSAALKKADVGIAMGTGSQVAQDAADMILMDDNFASIVKGIEEGRLIFANLKKSIAYTLTSNIPEITPFLCEIALQIPLALTTIMILCIDLGTDMLPAISFAYETAEQDIMKQPPRDRNKDKLVTWTLISWSYLQIGLIQAIAAFTTFFYVFQRVGHFSASSLLSARDGIKFRENNNDDDDNPNCSIKNDQGDCVYYDERMDILRQAQTAFLASIVIMQIGCGIAAKTRINSIFSHGMVNAVLNFGIVQEIILIALLTYAPFLNYAFGTKGLDAIDWVIAIPFAILVIIYDEHRKYWLRNLDKDSWFHRTFYY
jgi:sodium/potassium-transporting ATPase subunit alpha